MSLASRSIRALLNHTPTPSDTLGPGTHPVHTLLNAGVLLRQADVHPAFTAAAFDAKV